MSASQNGPRHSHRSKIEPVDPKDPGDAFIQREIDADRRSERILVPKALIALAFIAVIVIVRQAFFV